MGRPCQVSLAAAAALAFAALAGCASGPGNYSMKKTRACIRQEGGVRFRPLTPRADFVASLASGGAFALSFPHNAVTVTFGDDDKEAGSLAAGYRRLSTFATVETDRNVAIVWTATPSDQESAKIHDCLK
jgi:hypothetical protein